MARKVFISILGTSNYVECKYDFGNGDVSDPVRFIQEASICYLSGRIGGFDKILIFCTESSKKANWEDNGQQSITSEVDKVGLKTRLENCGYGDALEMCLIDDILEEESIWKLFATIYAKLEEGDEVYFDVTHSFRYIPMFANILFNFATFMKGISLRHILYGAFEKLGHPNEVRQKYPDSNDRLAPVLNLTSLVMLQQYTGVVESFVTFGRVNRLDDLELLTNDSEVNNVISALRDFDNALMTNRISVVKKGAYMEKLEKGVEPLKRSTLPMPIKMILNKVYEHLKEYGFVPKDSNQNIEAAIKWLSNYKMLAQAYTVGQEYIIALLVDKYMNKSPFKTNAEGRKKYRQFMSSVCAISDKDVQQKKFREHLVGHEDLVLELLTMDDIKALRPNYMNLTNNRNSINHGKQGKTYGELESEFESVFEACLNAIKE